MASGVSLNKYISSTGFCSRREADKYIEQGRVTINDEPVNLGSRVDEGDVVAIDGEPLKVKKTKQNTLYIAFNKPVGITSTTDTKDPTNIISYINYPKRIFPVGRLDKDSDGLIFLTNDGDIVNKILRAGNYHEKEYLVSVNKPVTPEFIHKMSTGVPVLGHMTRECVVRQEGTKRVRIILTQGMNRQIRRMCQHLDYKVMSLTRIRVMNIRLGNLPVGKWRLFTPQEIEIMNTMLSSSVKTEEASKAAKPRRARKEDYAPKETEGDKRKSVIKKSSKIQPKDKNKSYKEWRKKK